MKKAKSSEEREFSNQNWVKVIGLLVDIEDYLQKIIITSLFVFAVVFGGLIILRYF